ncbi:hypothetical protein AAKU55_005606 [Oxalobacteraceae bacterium GrIS 1.11]
MKIQHVGDVGLLRRSEYPPLEDLADALYHQSVGDGSKLDAYLASMAAVKARFPKNTGTS